MAASSPCLFLNKTGQGREKHQEYKSSNIKFCPFLTNYHCWMTESKLYLLRRSPQCFPTNFSLDQIQPPRESQTVNKRLSRSASLCCHRVTVPWLLPFGGSINHSQSKAAGPAAQPWAGDPSSAFSLSAVDPQVPRSSPGPSIL